MAKARINLQDWISQSSAPAFELDVSLGADVGMFTRGVAYVRVFRNASGSAPKFSIVTSPDRTTQHNPTSTVQYWASAGSVTLGSATATGVFRFAITDLADVIRWRVEVTGAGNVDLDFDIVVYLFED
jgi:hypothetical protein